MTEQINREKKTVSCMISMYCRGHHQKGKLCKECRKLLDYSMSRLDRCPYAEEKPACSNCPVHCYEKGRREQIRGVMRYSGPRMMLRHPVLAVRHLRDKKRKVPPTDQ